MSSPKDTDKQAAMKVLFCGGLAGIVTWASIFPLGKITEIPPTRTSADGFIRCCEDKSADTGCRRSLFNRTRGTTTAAKRFRTNEARNSEKARSLSDCQTIIP